MTDHSPRLFGTSDAIVRLGERWISGGKYRQHTRRRGGVDTGAQTGGLIAAGSTSNTPPSIPVTRIRAPTSASGP